jgi:hypothetical protein
VCTDRTTTAPVCGSARGDDDWFALAAAVVYFDHPQDALVDHALCIDFRARAAGDPGNPARHVAVELDIESARTLARTILDTVDAPGVRALTRSPVPQTS